MAKKNQKIANLLTVLRQNFTRKDIADWQAAINQTLAATPKWIKLQDIYQSILLDAHLTSQVELRKQRIAASPYVVKSSDKEIDTTALDKLLKDNISHIADSIFFGYSIVEIDHAALSTELLDRRNFDPRNHLFYPDPSLSSALPYRELPQYGFTLLEYNRNNNGILQQAAPHVLFKRFAQSCWSELCEIYGMPPRYIKTNTQDQELIARYEQMLSNIGSGASYVLDLDDEMGFAQTNATNGEVYERLITLCKNEISTLICGAVVGQDTVNGSNAKEQSSQDLLKDITESDKRYITSTLNSTLIPALISAGLLPQHSTFEFLVQEDTAQLFSQTMQAAAYFDINPEWVKERFGIDILSAKSSATAQLKNKYDFFE